jgi:hypothetical protein
LAQEIELLKVWASKLEVQHQPPTPSPARVPGPIVIKFSEDKKKAVAAAAAAAAPAAAVTAEDGVAATSDFASCAIPESKVEAGATSSGGTTDGTDAPAAPAATPVYVADELVPLPVAANPVRVGSLFLQVRVFMF